LNRSSHAAFTLVEVIASLMLLGTLLVGILVAHRRHDHQIRTSKLRLEAIEAADRLLCECRAKGSWGPLASSGRFADRSDLVWRWSLLTISELTQVGACIGRLEVFSTNQTAELPLAQIELVTSDGGITDPRGDAAPP
jgi:type II secretory pathway pseudopilin PulG